MGPKLVSNMVHKPLAPLSKWVHIHSSSIVRCIEVVKEGNFYHYMKGSDVSENHQNNYLKVVIAFANFLGTSTTFYDIKNKEQVTAFLDTKIKSREEDPDKKWITT
jgi:hypothetical protein